MTQNDKRDGLGYVICGYLDSEGVENITVEADPYSGQPFESIEEAWAEVESKGGPRDDANLVIGVVLPVGIIVPRDSTEEYSDQRVNEVLEAFGAMYATTGDSPDFAPAGVLERVAATA